MTIEERKEYNKQWREQHKNEILTYGKQWREQHRNEMLAYNKQWYQKHKDEMLARGKQWRETNKDKILAYMRQYREKNQDYFKQYREQNKDKGIQQAKAWKENHIERFREINRRHNSKRERNLGFIPLNKPFEGCEAHHINQNYVIYIPRELHQRIYHDLIRGTNMLIINALAVEYLQVEGNA